MGNKVNIQDGAVIHCTYQKTVTSIGSYVSIAHNAIVHGCTIEDNVLIGMGAIVMDKAIVQSNTIIAAGRADLCAIAKGHLSDPYLLHRHAQDEQVDTLAWPRQYHLVRPTRRAGPKPG